MGPGLNCVISRFDLRLFQVSSHHAFNVKENEERSLVSVVRHESAKARPAGIVPDFHPDACLEATGLGVDGVLLEAVLWDVVIRRRRLPISTRQAGAIHRQVPLTLEHGLHGLTKESLTFFPDL